MSDKEPRDPSIYTPDEDDKPPKGAENLRPDFADAIMRSELAGSVDLSKFPEGGALVVMTKKTTYRIEKRKDGLYISGNPKYCPEPTLTEIQGSSFGGGSIKVGRIVIGMNLEYSTPNGVVLTTTIEDIVDDSPPEVKEMAKPRE